MDIDAWISEKGVFRLGKDDDRPPSEQSQEASVSDQAGAADLLVGLENNLLIPSAEQISNTLRRGQSLWHYYVKRAISLPPGYVLHGSLDPYILLQKTPALPYPYLGSGVFEGRLYRKWNALNCVTTKQKGTLNSVPKEKKKKRKNGTTPNSLSKTKSGIRKMFKGPRSHSVSQQDSLPSYGYLPRRAFNLNKTNRI